MQQILLNEPAGTIHIHQPKPLPPETYILTQIHAMCIFTAILHLYINFYSYFIFRSMKLVLPRNKEGTEKVSLILVNQLILTE